MNEEKTETASRETENKKEKLPDPKEGTPETNPGKQETEEEPEEETKITEADEKAPEESEYTEGTNSTEKEPTFETIPIQENPEEEKARDPGSNENPDQDQTGNHSVRGHLDSALQTDNLPLEDPPSPDPDESDSILIDPAEEPPPEDSDLPGYLRILKRAFSRSGPSEDGNVTFTFDEICYLTADPDFCSIYPKQAEQMRLILKGIANRL